MSKIPKNASWYSETRGQGHEQSDLKSEMNGDSESEQELEETLNEKAKELRWKIPPCIHAIVLPKGKEKKKLNLGGHVTLKMQNGSW